MEEPKQVLSAMDASKVPSDLRQLLGETSLKDSLEMPSMSAVAKCWEAFRCAEEAAWDVFQDSMLTYGVPQSEQLDLLEIYAYPDSRLTECMREIGGRAMRFTLRDGDLSGYGISCSGLSPETSGWLPSARHGVPGLLSMHLEAPKLPRKYTKSGKQIRLTCVCVPVSASGKWRKDADSILSNRSCLGC